MPSFTEYLFAPWKLVSLFFPSATPAPGSTPGVGPAAATAANAAAAATNTAINYALCSVKDVGGQMLSVCHVGPYEMPSFVFVAALIILGLFILSSAGMLRQCASLATALYRIARRLEKLPAHKDAHRLSLGDLDAIRGTMEKDQIVAHAWKQFEETLLVSRESDEVFSTQSIESIFSKAALIEENVQAALYSAIPGILTGLGLLMTFVAILDGLSHVSVADNMDVKGIGGLINGLSGKFVSSIVAVTCAVLFVFVERIAYSQPARAYQKLVRVLTPRFRRKTTEHLLYEIRAQLALNAAVPRDGAPSVKSLPPATPPKAPVSARGP